MQRVVADLLEHGLGGPADAPAVVASAEVPSGTAEFLSAAPAEENAAESAPAEPVVN